MCSSKYNSCKSCTHMSENGLLIATSHTTQHAANKKWASHLHHTPHCIALPSKHRHHTRTTTTLEQLLSRRRPPFTTASASAAALHRIQPCRRSPPVLLPSSSSTSSCGAAITHCLSAAPSPLHKTLIILPSRRFSHVNATASTTTIQRRRRSELFRPPGHFSLRASLGSYLNPGRLTAITE